MGWNAQKYGNTLKNGDYFEVKLPDKFRFIEDSSAIDFPIYGVDGKVYGKGHLDVKKEGGGTLRVTLNEKVENLYNVKGKVSMASSFNYSKIKAGEKNKLEIEINGKKIPKDIDIEKSGEIDEILTKWPSRVDKNANEVRWNVRFNVNLHAEKVIISAVIIKIFLILLFIDCPPFYKIFDLGLFL